MPEYTLSAKQVLQGAIVMGACLAAVGVLIGGDPTGLPVDPRNGSGGSALAWLGGGLAMIAATLLGGRTLFAEEGR